MALESSSSSVVNVDMNETSFIRDTDNESDVADQEDISVMGHLANTPATDEQSKKSLRDTLRRTLTSGTTSGTLPCSTLSLLPI